MFSIVHWNSFAIKQNILALESFLNREKPNLFFINETKTEDDIFINNYETVQKNRDLSGGGVAILIRNDIKYKQNHKFDKYNLELICIEISYNIEKIYFISLYIPPNASFPPNEFFYDLNKLEKFILVGDLNCKSTTWYSSENNSNGRKLEEQIEQFNFSIIKNKLPTYYNKFHDKFEILDLAICSSNLLFRTRNLKILSSELISDHFPLYFELEDFNIQKNDKEKTFKEVNWENFTCDTELMFEKFKKKHDLNSENIQEFKKNNRRNGRKKYSYKNNKRKLYIFKKKKHEL
jgi:exonuclease III